MDKKELNKLIDQASANCGSDYKLALTIHASRSNLSAWRAGTRSVPVGDLALMAELAGLDAVAITNKAILDLYVNTPKADLVRSALNLERRTTGKRDAKSLTLF